MSLYTDGPPARIEELAGLDSQLLTVASAERIDVTRKLELAHEEVGLAVAALLNRTSPADQLLWAAGRPQIDNIVVTTALRLWFAYRTLELVYSDAYSSQLNDRYGAKRDQFQRMAASYREQLIEGGAGITWIPVPKAPTPALTTVPGSLPDNIYYVTAAWTNRANEEGESAAPTTIATSSSSFSVQLGPTPANATGWNVYVGLDPNSMTLQNETPLGVGATWVQPVWISATGRKPGRGQKPNCVQVLPRILQRG